LITVNNDGNSGILNVVENSSVSGIIIITVNSITSNIKILLINSSILSVCNLTLIVENKSNCKKVTATTSQEGSRLYALLNTNNSCGSNTNLIIGVTVATVGGAIILVIIIALIYIMVKLISKHHYHVQFSEAKKKLQYDNSVL